MGNCLLEPLARPFRLQETRHTAAVNYVGVSMDPKDIVVNGQCVHRPPRVITAGDDGICLVFEPINRYWVVTQVLRGHEEGVYSVVIAEDDDIVVTTSADKTLRVWRTNSQGIFCCTEKDVLRGHEDAVQYCCLNGSATLIASASADCTVRLWRNDLQTKQWTTEHVLCDHSGAVYGLAFSPDFAHLFTSSGDSSCIVWAFNGSVWTKQQRLPGHEDSINAVNISSDGNIVVTASSDKTAKVWAKLDGQTWVCVQTLSDHSEDVVDAALAEDLTLLATVGSDNQCRLYTVKDGEWKQTQVLKHNHDLWGVRVIPWGTRNGYSEHLIATSCSDMSATLWRWDGKAAYQKTSIRYATNFEIVSKVVSLIIKAVQKAKFAFSTGIPWKKEAAQPIRTTLKLSLIEFSLPLNISVKAQWFGNGIGSILAVIIFVLCANAGKGSVIVYIISALCVVPIMLRFAQSFACQGHDKLDFDFVTAAGLPNANLDNLDDLVECGSAEHLALAIPCAVACLVYLLMLLPFTAGDGDLEVMPRHVWCSPREWFKRKKDKLRGLDLGRLAPANGAIVYQYANLVAGIGLPVTDAFRCLAPFTHGVLVLGFAAVPLLSAIFWKPFQDPSVNAVVVTTHLLTFNSYAGGVYAIWLEEEHGITNSWYPLGVLFGGWVVIILMCCLVMQCQPKLERREARVAQLGTPAETQLELTPGGSNTPQSPSSPYPGYGDPAAAAAAAAAAAQYQGAYPQNMGTPLTAQAGYYGGASQQTPYFQQNAAYHPSVHQQPNYQQPNYQTSPYQPNQPYQPYHNPPAGFYQQPPTEQQAPGSPSGQLVDDCATRQAFIQSLWDEYIMGVPQAVGRFLAQNHMPPHLARQYESWEEQVPRSADRSAAIQRLAYQLGVSPPGVTARRSQTRSLWFH